jgi:aminoglycoside phosphotransferase family enzyme/predicted kinase
MYKAKEQSELKQDVSFASMLHMLAYPSAFPFALPDGRSLLVFPVIQTHASAVVLTPERVYKLKKPKNFGFFDFSTPALRRHFCIQEVRINSRLAPEVYLGIAPVLAFSDGRFCFGPVFSLDDVPLPGSPLAGGSVVDYAVVMVRLPDEAMLASRLREGVASSSLLAAIARYIAAFHTHTLTNEHIASFGSLDVIRGNWEENFEQMKPYLGRTLDTFTYDRIVEYVHRFLEERAALFVSRVQDGRIRDCHGDLRLQHVYILDEQAASTHPFSHLAILDGIEFNERFRYSDVASEVAFLAMELDAAGRPDLARTFIHTYVTETGDQALLELLPFYSCYRACVRGKVLSFQLDEPEVPETQQEVARQEAGSLFALAEHYASGPTRPTVIMIGGLMGTGKSTLALALKRELGWELFSSDAVRKHLAQLDPAQPQAEAFGQGWYSSGWTSRTYHALRALASTALARGRSVLLDASYMRRADRQALAQAAAAYGAPVLFVECICAREDALSRLAQRWRMRVDARQLPPEEASAASDGRPDLYDAQCAGWESFVAQEEPYIRRAVVTTMLPLAVGVEQVLDALHSPRLACWLALSKSEASLEEREALLEHSVR